VKFSALNPRIRQYGASPISLTFDCPRCGPPYTVNVPIILNGQRVGPDIPMWALTAPDPPNFSWDAVTITPSIDITTCGHGRKKPCNWHGNIRYYVANAPSAAYLYPHK
jgi:hypothetical protein